MQFPLTLLWVCTIHKVQGLSLQERVLSFDLIKQKLFNQGQMYVALSRITSKDRFYFIGKCSKTSVKVNISVKNEFERLRGEYKLSPASVMLLSESSFTLTLLTIASW